MQEHLPLGRSFSSDEIGEIIGYATRLDQLAQERIAAEDRALSYDQLRSVAEELGVDEMTLLEALHVHDVKQQGSAPASHTAETPTPRPSFLWRSFVFHLVVYAAIIALLSVIDVAGDGEVDWVVYPAAGWGIAIVIHGAVATLIARRPAAARRQSA